MESNPALFKSSSHQLMRSVSKELKKILPVGASQNQHIRIPLYPKKKPESILEKRRFTLEDQNKYTTSALSNYLDTHFKISALQSKSPFQLPDTIRRVSSPQVLKKSPFSLTPETIRRESLKRFIGEDSNNECTKGVQLRKIHKNSQNCEVIDDIMHLCDEAKGSKKVVPEKVVSKYTQHLRKFVNDIDDFICPSPETLKIDKSSVPNNYFKEYEVKETVRNMMKNNEKNCVRIDKQRKVSVLK